MTAPFAKTFAPDREPLNVGAAASIAEHGESGISTTHDAVQLRVPESQTEPIRGSIRAGYQASAEVIRRVPLAV